jgi:hypothetical protein
MSVRLAFTNEWRTYRCGESYDVPKPLAEILIRRGFAVVDLPKPKRRRRKKASNASDKDS